MCWSVQLTDVSDDCTGMRPTNSSPVVTRLLEAHGVVLGKTHMEELAEGLTTINPVYGPVLNPYNNVYDVGGGWSMQLYISSCLRQHDLLMLLVCRFIC